LPGVGPAHRSEDRMRASVRRDGTVAFPNVLDGLLDASLQHHKRSGRKASVVPRVDLEEDAEGVEVVGRLLRPGLLVVPGALGELRRTARRVDRAFFRAQDVCLDDVRNSLRARRSSRGRPRRGRTSTGRGSAPTGQRPWRAEEQGQNLRVVLVAIACAERKDLRRDYRRERSLSETSPAAFAAS
jgi:hypothetical protein